MPNPNDEGNAKSVLTRSGPRFGYSFSILAAMVDPTSGRSLAGEYIENVGFGEPGLIDQAAVTADRGAVDVFSEQGHVASVRSLLKGAVATGLAHLAIDRPLGLDRLVAAMDDPRAAFLVAKVGRTRVDHARPWIARVDIATGSMGRDGNEAQGREQGGQSGGAQGPHHPSSCRALHVLSLPIMEMPGRWRCCDPRAKAVIHR